MISAPLSEFSAAYACLKTSTSGKNMTGLSLPTSQAFSTIRTTSRHDVGELEILRRVDRGNAHGFQAWASSSG
jgi:hypothetical protein